MDIVTIEIMGQEFTLISAGPLFKLNHSVSFLVAFDSSAAVDATWEKLSKDGTPLRDDENIKGTALLVRSKIPGFRASRNLLPLSSAVIICRNLLPRSGVLNLAGGFSTPGNV